MRIGTIVRIKKPKVEVEWWANGMDEFIGHIGEITGRQRTVGEKPAADGRKCGGCARILRSDNPKLSQQIHTVKGADNSGIPYWFPEECLEVVK